MDKNVVFLADHTKSNVLIGNSLCGGEFSHAGYWISQKSDMVNDDSYGRIFTNGGIVFSNPKEENMKNLIAQFMWDLGYKPDLLVIKGEVTDFWAISSLIEEGVIDSLTISLIDYIEMPFTGTDMMFLDKFDKNLILSGKKDLSKELEIFKKISEENENFNILGKILRKTRYLEEFVDFFGNDNSRETNKEIAEKIKEEVFSNIKKNIVITGTEIV